MAKFSVVIASVGSNDSMKSKITCELHEISSKPIIDMMYDAAVSAKSERTVFLVDDKKNDLAEYLLSDREVITRDGILTQGCILMHASAIFKDCNSNVIVLSGAMPLVSGNFIRELSSHHCQTGACVTYSCDSNGRPCVFCFNPDELLNSTVGISSGKIACDGDYLVSLLEENGVSLSQYMPDDANDVFCVYNRIDLACAQNILKKRINDKLMLNGVTIVNPDDTYISPDAVIDSDVVIYSGTTIKGRTRISSGCVIGPHTTIESSEIGEDTTIINSVVIRSKIGSSTNVGPFAYIRPDCNIGSKIKIGDFVEVKNSTIQDGTKVSHLTYIGDSDVGKNINFGCGTITVNYDGSKKHRTVIEDNAFIGCNSNLVAPVTIKENAFIAAGSTITDDVSADSLAIARARQVVKENWRKNKQKEKKK